MATNDETIERWIDVMENSNDELENFAVLQEIYYKYQPSDSELETTLIETIIAFIQSTTNADNLANRLFVESSYRAYYKLLQFNDAKDEAFFGAFEDQRIADKSFILHTILYTDFWKTLNEQELRTRLVQTFDDSIAQNSPTLVIILRALNLYCKRSNFSNLDIKLEQIYFCMQSQLTGVREETMHLFEHCTKDFDKALEHLQLILDYWPWTNKPKFFLISVILGNHSFVRLQAEGSFDTFNFFEGLRQSLSYKKLFSAGQSVVRAIVKQNVKAFNLSVIGIIQTGPEKEILNLNSQWLRCIPFGTWQTIFELFGFVGVKFDALCQWIIFRNDTTRLVVVLRIFAHHFHRDSPENFQCIVDYLLANCLKFSRESQLITYKMLVDLLPLTAAQPIMDFILNLLKTNLTIPCSEFRHNIIGQMPLVFNFLAKKYAKNETNIVDKFFAGLAAVIRVGLASTEYQPLIFGLKIVDAVLKSLYSVTGKRVTKNSNVDQNQKLGVYLTTNVFDFAALEQELLDVLYRSGQFDDARELVINIIEQMKCKSPDAAIERFKKVASDPDVDRCFLSSFYVRIAKHNGLDQPGRRAVTKLSIRSIAKVLQLIEADPLLAFKKRGHIFGLFNCIEEIWIADGGLSVQEEMSTPDVIQLIEVCIRTILLLLSTSITEKGEEVDYNAPASFETMEESLELLVKRSAEKSFDEAADRKFLLLSFWMTLRSACELATTIGCSLVRISEEDEIALELLERCLDTNVTVLHRCRHKGAIESTGVSLGQLVRAITTLYSEESTKSYQLLFSCFSVLFGSVDKISTTRRGAGLSIMFHHLLKNDAHKERPLFRHAIQALLEGIQPKDTPTDEESASDQKYENFDALVLHYLCVLVKDTELRQQVSEYYDQIMMGGIRRMESREWTVRNAALQLFGALVPKIVGQKQATDIDEPIFWETSEVTYHEICNRLPKTCEHILSCCEAEKCSPSSLILFLEFLSKVEYIKKDAQPQCAEQVLRFRKCFWKFFTHPCEKVRKLSALCLVRALEYRVELPQMLINVAGILFKVQNENLFQAMLFALIEGVHKINADWKFSTLNSTEGFLECLRRSFHASYQFRWCLYYTRSLLIDLFILAGFDFESLVVMEILCSRQGASLEYMRYLMRLEGERKAIGYDLWLERISKIY